MASDPVLPARPGVAGAVLVRVWETGDAEQLNAAVERSREHLKPWMPFAREPPMPLGERRVWITRFDKARKGGGDALYGIFLADTKGPVEAEYTARVASDGSGLRCTGDDQHVAVGACGLHQRLAPDGLEIGYWLDVAHTGKGLATTASRILTDAAFEIPGITHAEIHHDQANGRSRGVPERLGYELVAEVADQVEAPGEVGIECRWRMTRERWVASRGIS